MTTRRLCPCRGRSQPSMFRKRRGRSTGLASAGGRGMAGSARGAAVRVGITMAFRGPHKGDENEGVLPHRHSGDGRSPRNLAGLNDVSWIPACAGKTELVGFPADPNLLPAGVKGQFPSIFMVMAAAVSPLYPYVLAFLVTPYRPRPLMVGANSSVNFLPPLVGTAP